MDALLKPAKKSKLPPKLQELLALQKILKQPTEEILQQLTLGVCLLIKNCRNCNIEVSEGHVQVNLYKFKGFKHLYYKITKKYKLTDEQTAIITKLVTFWLSFLENPSIVVVWK